MSITRRESQFRLIAVLQLYGNDSEERNDRYLHELKITDKVRVVKGTATLSQLLFWHKQLLLKIWDRWQQ